MSASGIELIRHGNGEGDHLEHSNKLDHRFMLGKGLLTLSQPLEIQFEALRKELWKIPNLGLEIFF
jgi:hypothetical protein